MHSVLKHILEMIPTAVSWRLVKNGVHLAYLIRRPDYCDRGRYHTVIQCVDWFSNSDPQPRYYFDLECGKKEVEAYLAAKKVDVKGATWEIDDAV